MLPLLKQLQQHILSHVPNAKIVFLTPNSDDEDESTEAKSPVPALIPPFLVNMLANIIATAQRIGEQNRKREVQLQKALEPQSEDSVHQSGSSF